MDEYEEEEFSRKLMVVLKKVTESGCKPVENTYLETLLTNLRLEYDVECDTYLKLPEVSKWLLETLESWETRHPNISVAAFICQFIGILSKNEDAFKHLQTENILDKLIDCLHSVMLKNVTLKVIFIRLLTDVVSHKSGYEWVIASKYWEMVISLFFLNPNFYIEQEGLKLFKKLFERMGSDDHVMEEILQHILLPADKNNIETDDINDDLYAKINVSFKLLQGILKIFLTLNADATVFLKLTKKFDFENFLKFLLVNCKHENTLEMASSLYILYSTIKFHSKQQLLSMECLPPYVLEIFLLLLQKNQINCIIKLSKFCQELWDEIRNQLKCESSIRINFIIFQLIPLLSYKPLPESKIFDLLEQSSKKFAFSLHEKIKGKNEWRNWALKGINSVTGNISCLRYNEAVVIFKSLAYVLNYFIPEKLDDHGMNENLEKELQKKETIFIEDVSLLSAVLNGLCILIDKFRINSAQALENMCLLKMICNLLENTNLSAILIVQNLLLVKLAILNLTPPDISIIFKKTENSSFDIVLTLLHKHMHNRDWEIRDSCIEVVATLAEIAESKYPDFQVLLIEKKICSLVCQIMEEDGESYVRASALRALSAMSKIESLRPCMIKLDLCSNIIAMLHNESEGIVRREAVLLLIQIYLTTNEKSESLNLFYEVMCFLAIHDLHWEVKINSLLFWETVIQKVFADHGLIDGSGPIILVNYSPEREKIEMLTNKQIKFQLDKALAELSKIGCFYVLLSTLNDDCDFQVVHKSAEILSKFIETLKRFDILKPDDYSISGRVKPGKRKYTDCQSFAFNNSSKIINADRTFHDSCSSYSINNSDATIEEIVNEMDINLLVSVHRTKETSNSLEKKSVLQEIKPETFLAQLKAFNAENFLEGKKKWLMHPHNDLKSVVNDIISINSMCETNVMDCY